MPTADYTGHLKSYIRLVKARWERRTEVNTLGRHAPAPASSEIVGSVLLHLLQVRLSVLGKHRLRAGRVRVFATQSNIPKLLQTVAVFDCAP